MIKKLEPICIVFAIVLGLAMAIIIPYKAETQPVPSPTPCIRIVPGPGVPGGSPYATCTPTPGGPTPLPTPPAPTNTPTPTWTPAVPPTPTPCIRIVPGPGVPGGSPYATCTPTPGGPTSTPTPTPTATAPSPVFSPTPVVTPTPAPTPGLVDTWDYFVTDYPDLCVAEDVNNLGTYNRTAIDTTSCPGKELFLKTLGSGIMTWTLEVYLNRPPWIGRMATIGSWDGKASNGVRYFSDGKPIGVDWMPTTLTKYPPQCPLGGVFSKGWVTKSYGELVYNNGSERICTDPVQTSPNISGVPFPGYVEFGEWNKFLYDMRSPNPNPVTKHPVQYIKFLRRMGNSFEEFIYGKWQDPRDSYKWHGLGLIGYNRGEFKKNWGMGDAIGWVDQYWYAHYLVSCQPKYPCFQCPR